MNLDIFIRCITFRVFLVVFLGVDPNTLVFGRLERVTTALSYFYDDAQGRNALPLDVQGILNEWLPRERFPSSLDRILPAYEALWRIVATLVVMCEDDQTRDLRWVMLDFRDNPWDRQYRSSFRADGKSVATITDEVVGHVTPIARSQHAATSTWPLSCIQYASASGLMVGNSPTVQEGLKFAALLASKVLGRIGLHFGISGDSNTPGSQASPWEQRKIFEINRSSSHLSVNVVESRSHASTSRQVH
ncbi:hypothetical protein EV363DRAFT_1338445 [Boletus edulis]|uniref:Uncharacterized protein n=1 Tax=Boletus edulis BED1 TaxID=1328754 RepID=A0AAD4BR43_BOLED|nr:hypothetical protein EV363DRAFT_1338445 [Boletus edulis]KAF8437582.1 hypothetical protein L210DRAFT_3546320 [Boletus edulis BED1]